MLPCMVFSEPQGDIQCNGAPEHAAWLKMGRVCPPWDTLTNGPHDARCDQSQRAINKSKGPQKVPQRHSPSPSPLTTFVVNGGGCQGLMTLLCANSNINH